MPLPILAGLSVAARTLLKTPAGQRAIARGSKSVARFLKRNDPRAFKPTDAQVAAGKKLQKTLKRKRLVKNIKVGAASGATGVAAGKATNKRKPVREDWRDMKATARKEEQQRKTFKKALGKNDLKYGP